VQQRATRVDHGHDGRAAPLLRRDGHRRRDPAGTERGQRGHRAGREGRRGAGQRHGLVLVGRLAAGADGPDELVPNSQRDATGQRGGAVQGERA
jgi:hypothetical protein